MTAAGWISIPVAILARCEKNRANHFRAVIPAPVRSPVNENGLKSGITGQNLPRIAGGWITFNNTFDIFAKTTKHVSRQELTIREQDNNRFGKNVHDSYRSRFRIFTRRCRRASYRQIPDATEIFRLSTEPNIGMATSSSQVSFVRRRIPSPSDPITKAVPPE